MVTRSQIEQAKQDVQQAQEQIGTSRQQVQQSRVEIEAARRGLIPKKRVPFTPRKSRLAKTRYKRKLTTTERKLVEQAKQLTEQEKEIQKYREEVLAPTETALVGFEKQQAAVQEKQAIYDQALSLYQRGKAWVARQDPRMRPIIKRIEAGESAARDQLKLQVDKFQTANPSEKLIVDWDKIKIKGVSSGEFKQSMSFDEYNKRLGKMSAALPQRDYVTYDSPLPAYYDPLTGKEVLQSMDQRIAEKRGLIPIEVTAFDKARGKYLIKSETGLLTPSQLAARKLFGGVYKGGLQELPTSFEIGGKREQANIFDFLAKTPYEAARMASPYSGKQQKIIDYQRLGEQGFYKKYGYYITPEGEPLGSGGVSPVTAGDILSFVGVGKALTVGATLGKKAVTSTGIVFADPITRTTSKIRDLIIPPKPTGFAPSGIPSQVGRGALFGLSLAVPSVGTAYVTEILKGLSVDPIGTGNELIQYAKDYPYEFATIAAMGGAELRVRQRVARSKMYYEVTNRLESQYGTNALEVVQFKDAWKRAFKELPKRSDLVQKWTSKDVEVIKGDKKLIRIIDEINSKYKPEIIGSTTITPQTTLKELPRRKAGDIDIQNVPALLRNKSKKMAYEIYNRLKKEGYNVRIQEGDFFGSPKYHITLNGKELINIGTNSRYFLKTQLGPLRDIFEFERIGQFRTDPLTGVKMGGIRGQLRVKLVKGYGEGSTARIRQLKQLMKEGKLVGREKDILDALGILEGTEYLFKEGKYIGPKDKLTGKDIYQGISAKFGEPIGIAVNKMDVILTGKTSKINYGYYKKIPTTKRRAYAKPSEYHKQPIYTPTNYLIPKYRPPKKAPYKKPPTYKRPLPPQNYLIPKYATPKKLPPYRPPKKPPYRPPLLPPYRPPQYKPPRKPPYSPPLIPPKTTPKKLLPYRKPKISKISKKKKEKEKKVLPTLSQMLINVRLGKKVRKPTGFEIARI